MIFKEITLKDGEPINSAWMATRWGQMQCSQHLYPDDYRAAALPMMELAARAPDSDDGQRAWIAAAGLAKNFDCDLGERLARQFLARHPKSIYAHAVNDALEQIALERAKRSATTAISPAPAR